VRPFRSREVHVFPPQPKNLAAAYSGLREHALERIQTILARAFEARGLAEAS